LDAETNNVLYQNGKYLKKILGVCKGYLRRLTSLKRLRTFDYIFVFRECTPLGPPIIEFILARILKKKIIYDFDDAIWLRNTSTENGAVRYFKWHSKVKSICTWSYKVSCGNKFLANYAQSFNQNVEIIPTIVDTENIHTIDPQTTRNKKLTIGWTGSFSTLKYLDPLIPIIKELELDYDFNFLVIANKDPQYNCKSFKFLPWKEKTEIDDLKNIDIGLMPLVENDWSKGKCGFKAIQYMSLGIPALVSPVGVNTEIVDHGVNGYICSSKDDWTKYLIKLIENPEIRKNMGPSARVKIENKYSLKYVLPSFLNLFK